MTLIGNSFRISLMAPLLTLLPLAPGAMASESVKPITEYPVTRKIWLGIEDGKIQPADQKNFRSSAEGYITFLKPNGSTIKKGENWAILDQEQVELEKRAIVLERSKLKDSIDKLKSEQEELIDKQQANIVKLNTQKNDLSASLETELLSDKLKKRVREAITELDEKIKKAEERIDPEKLERDLNLSIEDLTLALDRKERSHEKLLRRSYLKAEFDGILNLTLDNPNAPDKLNNPVWLDLGTSYASITNNSHFEIQVSNRNPVFSNFDPSKIIAMIDDGRSRQRIQANYKEMRKTELAGGMKDIHVFEFPPETSEYASKNSGEVQTIYLYLTLEQDCQVIPKREIALAAPEVLKKEGWPGLIKHLYPGYSLLHIGPKTLAVTKDNGDQSK